MLFPKMLLQPLLTMTSSAVTVVFTASFVMNRLLVADGILAEGAQPKMPIYEVVAQNTVAPGSLAPSADTPISDPANTDAANTDAGKADAGNTDEGNSIAADPCAITMDLMDDANAMIGVTLMAPCLPNSDVMISHAGMVFTAKTMGSGSVFLSLPALQETAEVTAHFSSGEQASKTIAIPEIKGMQRFAVQWAEQDGFAIHAYENGAGFDDAGHIWAQNPATPLTAETPESGYLTPLGDPSANMPMLAAVYTFPPNGKTEVVVEAAVTENTCGADLMGDAFSSVGGRVKQTEITVAMPDCAAVGEFVQLDGLVPDLSLALAD